MKPNKTLINRRKQFEAISTLATYVFIILAIIGIIVAIVTKFRIGKGNGSKSGNEATTEDSIVTEAETETESETFYEPYTGDESDASNESGTESGGAYAFGGSVATESTDVSGSKTTTTANGNGLY